MAPAVVAAVAQVVAQVPADREVAAVLRLVVVQVRLPQQPQVAAERPERVPAEAEVAALLVSVQGLVASQSLRSR